MEEKKATEERMPLKGACLLVLVCFLWGANIVSIRISNQGIPPLLAATLRSVLAAGLVALYAGGKGQSFLMPAGEKVHGMVIGFLFGMDFLFLYWGIAFTTASRSNIFLYTHPFWVALGAHFVLQGDRLTPAKVFGLCMAFAGVLAVFGARSAELPDGYWIGDLMEVVAAIFWGATTLYIKKTVQQKPITHYQTLFAQLFYSAPVLGIGSLIFECDRGLNLSGPILAAFAFQVFVVAFFSYVLWFWMIIQYPVSKLTAFTFLAPLFGVILGSVLLSEPVTPLVWLGMALVGGGIYVINRPAGKNI
ncbi:MAG TPA: DMT family transporter [Desulfobacteraceae bacterium]|nr:DMT family transporter [Desulfobacteraceae bacterium]HPJ69138.1 DMT family transporter [Desulfobacteraceae bacterium]HPQ28546.1 DMT family transporter [Desulfobacteraceae bacterium]